MKLVMRLMLVGSLLTAFAAVASADDRDDRRDPEGRWEDRDGSWDNDRDDRGDRREDRWDRREDRWDRREARRDQRVERRWDRRENRQDLRIRHGQRHGQITRGEAMRLRMLRNRIERMQRRAWADGHLNPYERMQIRRVMRMHGGAIGRFNHNDRSNVY